MGVAIYITTKKKIKGFDPTVNGKALGRVNEVALDDLCTLVGVPSLMGFISQDPDELEDFLEGEGMPFEGESGPPEEEWYTPEEGLSLVRPLIAHLRAHPDAIKNSAAIVEDLAEYEAVFVVLEQKKVKWHLAVDF